MGCGGGGGAAGWKGATTSSSLVESPTGAAFLRGGMGARGEFVAPLECFERPRRVTRPLNDDLPRSAISWQSTISNHPNRGRRRPGALWDPYLSYLDPTNSRTRSVRALGDKLCRSTFRTSEVRNVLSGGEPRYIHTMVQLLTAEAGGPLGFSFSRTLWQSLNRCLPPLMPHLHTRMPSTHLVG